MQTLQAYIKRNDGYRLFASNKKANIKVEGLDGFPLLQCALLMGKEGQNLVWLVCPTEEIAR
ncbi:MAG: hypothetical protein HUK24_06380, partial [Sphaerochaetaceae bacterium]|nr:hypothetical protein [Sphaerochaetaceae bacterium]